MIKNWNSDDLYYFVGHPVLIEGVVYLSFYFTKNLNFLNFLLCLPTSVPINFQIIQARLSWWCLNKFENFWIYWMKESAFSQTLENHPTSRSVDYHQTSSEHKIITQPRRIFFRYFKLCCAEYSVGPVNLTLSKKTQIYLKFLYLSASLVWWCEFGN